MSEDDSDDEIKSGIAIVGEIIKSAKNDPNVKQAGKNLGKAAVTITTTINNALLPLAAVNYAFDKAKEYFKDKFQAELSEKASSIPLDKIIEPKASIAGPALQGLAFSHEEQELKDMYLNLLATAMDGRVSNVAHPAFVEIIRQLSAEEGRLLNGLLKLEGNLAICEFRKLNKVKGSWNILFQHCFDLKDRKTSEPVVIPNITAYVNNWVRLGLIEIDYTKHVSGSQAYDWVQERPEFLNLSAEHNSDTEKVIFQQGAVYRTAFGKQFAQSVGILEADKK